MNALWQWITLIFMKISQCFYRSQKEIDQKKLISFSQRTLAEVSPWQSLGH